MTATAIVVAASWRGANAWRAKAGPAGTLGQWDTRRTRPIGHRIEHPELNLHNGHSGLTDHLHHGDPKVVAKHDPLPRILISRPTENNLYADGVI
ncbi:hypothetical protein [Scrofimicrobium canadense]|uniref:hypothetical protein n=1 Tax=Scrofimicrobium canadense TaxID=2652290 RepID=UPI0012B23A8E|nr:hypothetical protein [Scrofimicrobium canadense]